MPYGLISLHDEMRQFFRIYDFYTCLYPEIKFSKEDSTLEPSQIGDILYTYAGEEIEALAKDKMREIEDALPGYNVPAIVLKKGKKLILLDGHRRLRVAWRRKLPWKVLIIKPSKGMRFGVEDTAIGKVKEIQ